MLDSIWKFVVAPLDQQDIAMPHNARVLHVAEQHGSLVMWARVVVQAPLASRRVFVIGTGHSCPIPADWHIGTVLMHEGSLVWHVFLDPHETLLPYATFLPATTED